MHRGVCARLCLKIGSGYKAAKFRAAKLAVCLHKNTRLTGHPEPTLAVVAHSIFVDFYSYEHKLSTRKTVAEPSSLRLETLSLSMQTSVCRSLSCEENEHKTEELLAVCVFMGSPLLETV